MRIDSIRPPDLAARRFRGAGFWRDSGPISDLCRWRDATPGAPAIMAYRADEGSVRLSYAEYAGHVERFAGALYELGVRPGDVVACQLPSWWQAQALLLAATRLEAVAAPIMTTIRPRELERMLRLLGASVCVTVDEWAGFGHAAALGEIAHRLPELRHRVVIGEPADGEIDFRSFFEETPWEGCHPVALDDAWEDPDCVALVLFTSGTSGEPKGALHTQNTMYASAVSVGDVHDFGRDSVRFTPHALMHIVGQDNALAVLLAGASMVLLDDWSGGLGLRVLAGSGTTDLVAGPSFVHDVIAATGGKPACLPALRTVRCVGTTVPKQLVPQVSGVLGARLLSGWGMTEIGTGTVTRSDDPPDWAAHSDGRPVMGMELDLRSVTEITKDRPGRLFVRGSGVCLATVGRDSGELTVTAEHDDGWYDTGDLAVPDGRGGIRLMGRAGDRIGGVFMIPVGDVESELLKNPGVEDVALVGYPESHGGELACAVVVPATEPPVTLDELRTYLADQGMTEWYLPSRVEYVDALPRNGNGKVRKELLRRRLVDTA
ncbi:AMP-binding protein [Pseudonocardia xinjiangensis]|uniref:AMP-binding protein n=1 Tax=Pseudonocardia xinjiangensis TaxID=75289 RepID=UPI003D8B8621